MATPEQIRQAVRAVTDRDGLLNGLLAATLGWPVPDAVEDSGPPLLGGRLRRLHRGPPWGIFLVESADGPVFRTTLRDLARRLRTADSPAARPCDNWLFVCATRDYGRLTFAHVRCDGAQPARLATFGWRRGDARLRTVCEFHLPALAWPEDGGRDADRWLHDWAAAFDKEPLTRDFLRRVERLTRAIADDLRGQDELPPADAYGHARLLLERLAFLSFLPGRGGELAPI